MSVYSGSYIYKEYDIMFWLTPKTIKATIWKKGTGILVKRLWTTKDYVTLKKRVLTFIDRLDKANSGLVL